MHLFVCVTSFLLTFHLPYLEANNFTFQNVQETNFSQSLSFDDISENTTSLDSTVQASSSKDEEVETITLVVPPTVMNPDGVSFTPPQKNASDQTQNQTDEITVLSSADTTKYLVENVSVTSSVAETLTDSDEEISTTGFHLSSTTEELSTTEIQYNRTSKEQNLNAGTAASKTENQINSVRSTTTAFPAPIVNVATLEYESDKNHDELILSDLLPSKHAEDDSEFFHRSRTEHITPTFAELTPAVVEAASGLSATPDNVTSFEETVEHNAILTTDFEAATDKTQSIVVGHKCTRIFQESILWNVTDGGMLALKSCPSGYQGNMYRPCFSNGKWGNVDYSECRLEHLGRMRHMVS